MLNVLLVGVLVVQDEKDGGVEPEAEALDDRFVNLAQHGKGGLGDLPVQLCDEAFHGAAHVGNHTLATRRAPRAVLPGR